MPVPKPHRSSADARIAELDQKWSDRYNRLEALLLAKTLDKLEPTFSTFTVTPTHSPPVGAVRSTEPFIRPPDRIQSTDLSGTNHFQQRQATDKSRGSEIVKQPSTSDLPGSAQTVSRIQSTSKSSKDKPPTDCPSDLAGTDSPALHQVSSKSSSAPARRQSPSSMETDSDSEFSDRPPADIFVEEGELSDQDPDVTVTDPNQNKLIETMRGIRSFMGWTHIPDMYTATSTSDNNPFAGSQVHYNSKGGETNGHTQGYKNPPVPRRLVGESQIPPGLSPVYTGSAKNVSTTGLADEPKQIRSGTQTGFQLCRLPILPHVWSGPTHIGLVAESSREGLGNGCTQPVLGGSGPICLPTGSHLGQSGGALQDYPCSRIILIAPGWL